MLATQKTDPSESIGPAVPIKLSALLLDNQNPRLAEYGINAKSSQEDLVKVLWERMAVAEVAMSIAYSGYFEYEPLFVQKEGSKYVVIEGNRRLAAVLVLTDPVLQKKVRATDLPTLSAAARNALQRLPAIVSTKRALWRYLGFKHVNGPATWGSYAKAQYVALVHNEYSVPLAEIAAQIGDYNSTVERMYRGLMIVEQAERAKVFDREDVSKNRFHFNYIYTAMDYPGVVHFVGLKKGSVTRNPIPLSKVKQLGEMLTWMYGKDSANKPSLIKSQNPDLKIFDSVLLSDRGVQALRDGFPLAVARDISLGDEKIFRQALVSAKQNLQKALGTTTTGFDPKDTECIDLATDISQLATDITDAMHLKRSRQRASDRGQKF